MGTQAGDITGNATRQVSVMQVMQQSNIASSNATTSYNYGPPPPQQFSRAVQQQASVSRSMASNQNMGISSSQQMSPPPVSRQYFSQVEVCTTPLSVCWLHQVLYCVSHVTQFS